MNALRRQGHANLAMLWPMRPLHPSALALVALLACCLPACSATPPPNWAQGGARITVEPARWNRGDGVVELRSDGTVVYDRTELFVIDAAGRVFETDSSPIAVLQPDGRLIGTDTRDVGAIGIRNAAFPGASYAWLSVGPRGEVLRYEPDGERTMDGQWQGCTEPVLRTCALVTHLILLREWNRRPHSRVGVGFGFGTVIH